MRLPKLHVVTDDQVLARSDFVEAATAVMAAGGSGLALHLRGPGLSGRALHEALLALRPAADTCGTSLFVNDRVDVALANGLSRIHLGRRSLPIREARRLVGPGAWIGCSCHEVDEVHEVAREGADFVFLGTLYQTPSHPSRTGTGAGLLTEARSGDLPLIGIGGIGPERVPAVIAAGGFGVAVIRGVWHSDDPGAAAKGYLDALDAAA